MGLFQQPVRLRLPDRVTDQRTARDAPKAGNFQRITHVAVARPRIVAIAAALMAVAERLLVLQLVFRILRNMDADPA
jgi:hypothetical protein